MRIGLIADIHANLQALQAVLADAHAREVDMIWNMGDFVGYGPNPEEVVQINQQTYIFSILGNYDRKVLKLFESQKVKTKTPLKQFAFQWAFDQLSMGSRAYLRSLPETARLHYGAHHILLAHGSPESRDEALTPETPEARFLTLARQTGAHIIICGHTHQAFIHKTESTVFINPGSVGRQDDSDYRAAYAILELGQNDIQCEHLRLDYEIERTLSEMKKNNFPAEFTRMFREGKNLDTILEES